MATELLSLVAKIGIDDKEYNKGLDGAENKASKFGKGLKTAFKVGAAAIAATTAAVGAVSKKLYDGVKATAEYGDNVDKMSQKMGISAKAYQEWDAVMKHNGTTIDALKPSMKTLANQAQQNAAEFKKLGISEEEVANLSQEDLFGKVIEGLQGMEAGTERTAITSKLLGRGATELGALLNQSAEDTRKMKDEVNALGGVMSDDAVKASAEFQDSLQDMNTAIDGLKRGALGKLMPYVTSGIKNITSLLKDAKFKEKLDNIKEAVTPLTDAIKNFFKSEDDGKNTTEKLYDALDKIATILNIVSQGLGFVIDKLKQFKDWLTSDSESADFFASAIEGIIAVIIAWIAITKAVTIVQTLLNIVMMANPIGIVIGLIAALVVALVLFFSKNEKARKKLKEIWDAIKSAFTSAGESIKNVFNAIKSKIDEVVRKFENFKSKVKDTIDNIKQKFTDLKNKAKTWGIDMMTNFISGITAKIKALRDKITSVAKTISDKLHFSVPEDGPLADADKWMPDFMDLLASGIDDNKFKVTNAVDSLAGDMVFGGGYDDYGYETVNDTQKFEFTFAEGNAPLLQIARLLFPYMKVVSKEKGAAMW